MSFTCTVVTLLRAKVGKCQKVRSIIVSISIVVRETIVV